MAYAKTISIDGTDYHFVQNLSCTIPANFTSGSTVTCTGVKSDSIAVMVSPAPGYQDAYAAAGLQCTAQGNGTLTFTCVVSPPSSININVVVMG